MKNRAVILQQLCFMFRLSVMCFFCSMCVSAYIVKILFDARWYLLCSEHIQNSRVQWLCCRVIDSDVRMLHDHLVQSNSGDPSLATPYHQHHAVRARRTLHHHQLDDDQYVNRVGLMTWTDPCYDVINPQCAYSQHSASSSIRVCGHRPPAARVTPVTSAQWPYTAGHLQPTTDWTSPLPAAVATSTLWNSTHSLPDDRVFTYNTIPHSSSAVQFGSHYSSTDSVMPCWRLDGTEPSSPEMTTNSSTLTPINSKLDVFMTSTHNRQSHHQLTHMSTPAYYPPCNVSSSSDDTQVLDDNTKHQFGAKPTRASTSIGTFLHRQMPYYCRLKAIQAFSLVMTLVVRKINRSVIIPANCKRSG